MSRPHPTRPDRRAVRAALAARLHRPRITPAVAASTELQERDALKNVGLASAMAAALIARGAAGPLAGELGVLAFKRGYARWSESDRDDAEGLAPRALTALEDRAATASLG